MFGGTGSRHTKQVKGCDNVDTGDPNRLEGGGNINTEASI